MAIVWADVTAVAPETSTAPVAMQTAILALVNQQLTEAIWGELIETGRAYLAAHFATLSSRGGSGGTVVSESAGAVSRSYASPSGLDSTGMSSSAYGNIFMTLVRSLAAARVDIA